MKIRIPLLNGLEAKIEIAKPNRSHWTTDQLDPQEYDVLMAALAAQRPNITGQPWSDVAATDEEPAEPDYAALIDVIKQTGGSVEINGVKITPCDTYGRTQDEQASPSETESDDLRAQHLMNLPLKIGSMVRYAGRGEIIQDEYSGKGFALVRLANGTGDRVMDKRAITHIDGKAV